MLNLRSELATLEHIHLSTHHFAQHLSALDKEELFKKVKRLIGKNDNLDKQIRTSIAVLDPDTEAQFVGYAITNKHQTAMDKFAAKYELYTWREAALTVFANKPEHLRRINQLASDQGITHQQAIRRFLLLPETKAPGCFHEGYLQGENGQASSHLLFRGFQKSGVPYIALSRGQHGADAGIAMVDNKDVTAFEKALPKFSTPLEFEQPRPPTRGQGQSRPCPGPGCPAPTHSRSAHQHREAR